MNVFLGVVVWYDGLLLILLLNRIYLDIYHERWIWAYALWNCSRQIWAQVTLWKWIGNILLATILLGVTRIPFSILNVIANVSVSVNERLDGWWKWILTSIGYWNIQLIESDRWDLMGWDWSLVELERVGEFQIKIRLNYWRAEHRRTERKLERKVDYLELSDEITMTWPRIVGQWQEAQVRISWQLDDGVINESIVTQVQHLQILQMTESLGMDEFDAIILQVELA